MNTKILMCATCRRRCLRLAPALPMPAASQRCGRDIKLGQFGQVVCARDDGAVGELGSLARLRRDGQRRWLRVVNKRYRCSPDGGMVDVPRPRDLLHEVSRRPNSSQFDGAR